MTRELIKKIFIYLILIIGALIMIFPFYWMISRSLMTVEEYSTFPPIWIPKNIFNFDNFVAAFKAAPFATYFANSLMVTTGSVLLTGFTTIIGAFAFSRLKFPGKEFIFALLVAFMMVPFEMLVITNYQTVTKLRWIDSIHVLIIPFMTSIFYTYILKGFFDSIPDSLYYSARIDGASNWKYLWRVMVPMAKSSLATIILLNSIATWNSFLWPMIATNSKDVRTLPFGLYAFMTEGGQRNERMMAASTIVVIPMIIIFLFARKYIISGMSRGGIKG